MECSQNDTIIQDQVETPNKKFVDEENNQSSNGNIAKNVDDTEEIKQDLKITQLPRRLSKLFYPEKEEESNGEKDQNATEQTLLLESPLSKAIKRNSIERLSDGRRVKPNQRIDLGDKYESDLNYICDEQFSSRSSATSSSDEGETEKYCDGVSWDDTICSNRSAYFKHYYQRNLSGANNTGNSGVSTTHNSLVSLIREKNKLQQKKSSEEKKKRKHKEDISLMILVIFLFLLIVIGISLIYHFYHIHLEELSLFKRLKFHEDGKLLNLLDIRGDLDIQARLGTHLPLYSKPEDCTQYLKYFYKQKKILKKDQNFNSFNASNFNFLSDGESYSEFQYNKETVCLDWANLARLQIHEIESKNNVNCYNVLWSAHVDGLLMQDCIKLKSPEHGVWWGIGEIKGGGFPLESIKNLPPTQFQTGDLKSHYFGKILRRTFLSSFGGLFILPDYLPASISIQEGEICVSVNSTDFRSIETTLLNYTICSSPNITSTLSHLSNLVQDSSNSKISNDSERELLRKQIIERIEYPVWLPNISKKRKNGTQPRISERNILNYVKSVIKGNQSYWGTLLLPLSWQSKIGNFDFDQNRFPNPKKFFTELKKMGFDVALSITPLVSTDADAFDSETSSEYWVHQKRSLLPALIKYNGVQTGVLTDFTNPAAINWFISHLNNIKNKYGISRFHLNPPDAQSIPFYHEFKGDISNSDLTLNLFFKAVSAVEIPFSIESTITPPPLPTFVLVSGQNSNWKTLKSLIPRILTLSMLGFPLIDAGVVGGPHSLKKKSDNSNLIDSHLFIRWFQAVAFLPAFQFDIPLHKFDNLTSVIISSALDRRKKLVLPRLRKAVLDTLVNNTSLIYPLGLLYSDDVIASSIGDEWILGGDLLVAPILEQESEARDIYIPDGLWESQLDGKLKRGPGWIRNYSVPLAEIAYFLKRFTM